MRDMEELDFEITDMENRVSIKFLQSGSGTDLVIGNLVTNQGRCKFRSINDRDIPLLE